MISSSDILRASILIVDDQEDNIALLEDMLRGAGHVSIASTRDPHEVCELYRKNRYSLILLDLEMPGLNGFQVLEGLQAVETNGYLPVLVITGHPDHNLRALKTGAKDFISRPFSLPEALVRVQNMLEVRLLHLEVKKRTEQAQALGEQAMRSSALTYRRLFEAAKDGILILDIDTGRINDVNPFLTELLGYSKSEMTGKTVGELSPFKDTELNKGMLDRLQKDGYVRYEDVLLETRGGRKIAVEIVSNVYQAGESNVIQCNLRDITQRKRVEEELRASHEQLRALAARIQAAREEERTHAAREIHDVLAQELTGLKMEAAWLSRRLAEPSDSWQQNILREKVAAMMDLTDQASQSVQRIAAELRPAVLDSLGLCAATEWVAADFQKRTEIPCKASVPAGDLVIDGDHSTALFRILQESLANITRHACASKVEIRLWLEAGGVILTIADDGRGIRPNELNDARSMGLLGMRERASLLDGKCTIAARAGGGTVVEVRLPMSRAD
ncbi:MAG: response regulator [Limisphaerales bacterium]